MKTSSSTLIFLRATVCSSFYKLNYPLDTVFEALVCTLVVLATLFQLFVLSLSLYRYCGLLIYFIAQNGAKITQTD